MRQEIDFIDLFAGGGGTSTGAFSVPNIKVVAAVNHDDTAIKTHAANHPETQHFREDLWILDEKRLPKCNVLWASLECTDHSKAKGGRTKDIGSFALGHCMPRYIKWCDPQVIFVENVPEFVRWGELDKKGKRIKEKEGQEYIKWVNSITALGYKYDKRFLNAANYGCPTRRVRYFGIFVKPDFNIFWPEITHAEKENLFGLPKWIACKDYIDLQNEGISIFGRNENEEILPHRRKPLSTNTLKRIAGGIKKFAPDIYFIMKYYGTGDNCQSIDAPLHTIRTKESHALITCEKMQFIQDHCHTPNYNLPDAPLNPQLTRQTKQLITLEKQFLSKYYNGERADGRSQHHCQGLDQPFPTIKTTDGNAVITTKAQFYTRRLTNEYANQPLEKPAPTITTCGNDAIVTIKSQFISTQNNSNGHPEANNSPISSPLPSPTTEEKFQFITAYFNSGGHPETQNQSIERPLNCILADRNKHALVTADQEGFDFDIKMRFLSAEELASIMGFPEGYFNRPGLKLSKKKIIKMVGNAVPVRQAKVLIEPMMPQLLEYFTNK
jgi:DNA (cytosine-5)-methyltransferase 1